MCCTRSAFNWMKCAHSNCSMQTHGGQRQRPKFPLFEASHTSFAFPHLELPDFCLPYPGPLSITWIIILYIDLFFRPVVISSFSQHTCLQSSSTWFTRGEWSVQYWASACCHHVVNTNWYREVSQQIRHPLYKVPANGLKRAAERGDLLLEVAKRIVVKVSSVIMTHDVHYWTDCKNKADSCSGQQWFCCLLT